MEIKTKINKWDLIKLKAFASNGNNKKKKKKRKDSPQNGRNICKLCDQQGISLQTYNQLMRLNIIKTNQKMGKWA